KKLEAENGSVKNASSDNEVPCPGAVQLFYPRDISALRSAYQAQSIFSSPNSQESDTPRKSLSTDLADPAGEANDTVCSAKYADKCFAPANHYPDFSIPDYKSPFWVVPLGCQIADRDFMPADWCEPYFRP